MHPASLRSLNFTARDLGLGDRLQEEMEISTRIDPKRKSGGKRGWGGGEDTAEIKQVGKGLGNRLVCE